MSPIARMISYNFLQVIMIYKLCFLKMDSVLTNLVLTIIQILNISVLIQVIFQLFQEDLLVME